MQEPIDIKAGSISFNAPATNTVTGKDSKVRIIPLSSNAASIINKYAGTYQISESGQHLFTNHHKEPLTRSGVTYILRKYVEKAKQQEPEFFGNTNVHPYVLRRSKAMHLLERGVNLIYIKNF